MALSHQPLARPPRRSAGPLQPPRPGAARSSGPRRGAGCVGLHGPPLDMGTVMPRVAGCKRWVSPCQRGVTGQRLQWPVSVPCGWTIEVGSVWWFQPSLQPPPTPHTQQGRRGRLGSCCSELGLGGPVPPAVGDGREPWQVRGVSPSICSHAMCCFGNACFFLRQKYGCQSPPQGSVGTGTEQQPKAGSWREPCGLW